MANRSIPVSVLLVLFLAASCGTKEADTANSCGIVEWYADLDGDSYGDHASVLHVTDCSVPPRYVANAQDCDDTNADANPAAMEVCDEFSVDEDCNPGTDANLISLYADMDGDGYGDPGRKTMGCKASEGFVADNTDCDDTNADVNPSATEDEEDAPGSEPVDDDCDGSTTDHDDDDDGVTAEDGDCNDADPDVYPGADEICDGIDNNCNFKDDGNRTWHYDHDGDGYGNGAISHESCAPPTGYVLDSTDCDDTNAAVNPNATEINDGIDNDCDGLTDEIDKL